mmetsp:Transcript_3205/g.13150  ORF Transcript_3205/g.13150 Transcript_3205/m.13150 type:complete len:213 (+) Transcript_3205:2336-2974(+)
MPRATQHTSAWTGHWGVRLTARPARGARERLQQQRQSCRRRSRRRLNPSRPTQPATATVLGRLPTQLAVAMHRALRAPRASARPRGFASRPEPPAPQRAPSQAWPTPALRDRASLWMRRRLGRQWPPLRQQARRGEAGSQCQKKRPSCWRTLSCGPRERRPEPFSWRRSCSRRCWSRPGWRPLPIAGQQGWHPRQRRERPIGLWPRQRLCRC